MLRVDLNSDMGEGFGAYKMGDDTAMLDIVTSANVACGFHAGDPQIMTQVTATAIRNKVDIGAHPGFMDLWGFGRRYIKIDDVASIEPLLIYQIGALQAIAHSQGGRVTHIKTHGALGNMAFTDRELSEAIVRAIKTVDRDLILVTSPHNETDAAAMRAGVRVACEIFADRAYGDNGLLIPRGQPGAMVDDPKDATERVLRMLQECAVISESGEKFPTQIHTICVHGDSPHAITMAQSIKEGLLKNGVTLAPISTLDISA
ncbi:5-oxoprolinase subunit PxpA [Paenalcaligenes niemegkensis]|uniref:LamB/YcsF family protein n=1 Tax=Paenalcaligenes niemegkensis TaxID=2895469 RepID=UPI001EE8C04E|nr:5-oxoprolinase subunit PxpA [Paenalcaligenes niemegkensis]MCQ9618046.1 5-oxoprolinase subunit PxpA [Paenalcaligenes niemegkensis]